ncbi:MAG: helix-turn-helix domain-containing protein [Chitinophagales bacterium]|nr:helix-turn-helix domain-containing protein [Chitinophagales bacterium]
MIGQNIKYLRKHHHLSQQELADKLSIPRSTISDYEREYTQINLDNLIKLSDLFKIKMDDLVKTELWHRDLEIARNQELRVLAISVDADNNSNIELVETRAEAGYLESFNDPEYIRDLPKIAFPNIPQGTYRGFDIHGDSMLPIEPGSVVICSFVERLQDVKQGKTYVIVSKSEGLVYKRVVPDFKHNKLMLFSDNEAYLPYEIVFGEIKEIWQYYAHLSFSDARTTMHTMLDEKLGDIQRKLTEVHQIITR